MCKFLNQVNGYHRNDRRDQSRVNYTPIRLVITEHARGQRASSRTSLEQGNRCLALFPVSLKVSISRGEGRLGKIEIEDEGELCSSRRESSLNGRIWASRSDKSEHSGE